MRLINFMFFDGIMCLRRIKLTVRRKELPVRRRDMLKSRGELLMRRREMTVRLKELLVRRKVVVLRRRGLCHGDDLTLGPSPVRRGRMEDLVQSYFGYFTKRRGEIS